MSQDDKLEYLKQLNKIERLISGEATTYIGNLSPHSIIEVLKQPCEGNPELTELGKLLQDRLSGSSQLEAIRWVTFHFAVPDSYVHGDESTTRNWVSVKTSEQPLLNEIHNFSSINIDNYYAPSVISKKIESLNIPFEQKDVLLQKMWLYRLDKVHFNEQHNYHSSSCHVNIAESDMLCFFYDDESAYVFSCNNDHSSKASKKPTLGALLHEEDDWEVRNKFLNFVDAIRSRRSSEYNALSDTNVEIQCNFYARIPVFFGSDPRYMTELFIAFHEPNNNMHSIVSTLKDIESSLRLCVSLINSQIAYSIGHLVTLHERLQEQRHTIFNSWPDGILLKALNTEEPSEAKKLLKDAIHLTDILEASVKVALDDELPENFPDSLFKLLQWLYKRQQSRNKQAKLIIDDNCNDVRLPGKKAAAAYTVVWNLWDNAEKASHFAQSDTFTIHLRHMQNKSGVNIIFENKGVMEKKSQDFLLSTSPLSGRTEVKSGLMIVKKLLYDLTWSINEVKTNSGKTQISILIPYH